MHILIQVHRLAMVVRFWNHLKTVADPEEQLRYVRSEIDAVIAMQKYGTPL